MITQTEVAIVLQRKIVRDILIAHFEEEFIPNDAVREKNQQRFVRPVPNL